MAIDYGNIIGRKPYRPFSSYIPSTLLDRTFDVRGNLASTDVVAPRSFDPLNENIDLKWAGKTDDSEKFNTYYDYYFTGEDIKIYIDGLFDPKYELDIQNFAFNIAQQKQPLYGFWSYNYDVMMVGTRIVVGQFSVYSRYPGRMRDLLSEAAKQRVAFNKSNQGEVQSFLSGYDTRSIEDEKNIEKYWANSQLDRLGSDGAQANDRNIFSAHPPFNLIIKYGMQEGAVSSVARNKGTNSEDNFDTLDRLMATDYNQRLVQKNMSENMNLVLQSVHLNSMVSAVEVGGQPVMETYQFTARDFYISEGSIRNFNSSENPASDDSSEPATTDPTKPSTAPTEEDVLRTYEQYYRVKDRTFR
jgi:hypothetical protein